MLEYHKYYFDAMNRLGAKIFVFHGNMNAVAVPDDFYFEVFDELSRAAERFGIVAAQENVARCQSHSLEFMKNMTGKLGSRAKFVLDVKQALRSGEDPVEIVRTLGSGIVHVHMSDNSKDDDCLVPGKGNFDIYSFLSLLHEKGFDGTVMIELYRRSFQTVSELTESCAYIESLIKRIEERKD